MDHATKASNFYLINSSYAFALTFNGKDLDKKVTTAKKDFSKLKPKPGKIISGLTTISKDLKQTFSKAKKSKGSFKKDGSWKKLVQSIQLYGSKNKQNDP